jgi:hypothetical protein
MSAQSKRKLLCRIDATDADGGEAVVLLYQFEDDFNLVVTTRHGGDLDVYLPKKDLAIFHKTIGEIFK